MREAAETGAGGANEHAGMCGLVKKGAVTKKNSVWAETFSFSPFFRSTQVLSNNWPYMWALKSCFVRGWVELILVIIVLQSFNFYSIEV